MPKMSVRLKVRELLSPEIALNIYINEELLIINILPMIWLVWSRMLCLVRIFMLSREIYHNIK